MADKVIHGYWGTRGAGQTSRLLLAFAGAVWEDVKYTAPEQWFGKDKQELGFDFPNLPYLIDGDFKLTETKAIHRYIIKKYGKQELLGKSSKEEAQVDCLLGVLQDIVSSVGPLFWDKEYEAKIPAVIEKIGPKIAALNKFYGEREFALGYLTLVDFHISEFANYIEKIFPEEFAKNPFAKRCRDAVNNLPEIKKYYEQETAVKGPFVPPTAALSF